MIRIPLAAALICLSACQQSHKAGNDTAAPQPSPATTQANAPTPGAPPAAPQSPAPTPTDNAVPASYDWTFITHGGSGDLSFGDGDPAEGVSLMALSCLPGSGQSGVSWRGGANAILTANGETVAVPDAAILPLTHPVLRGFATSGSITLAVSATERVLTAKPGTGRTAVESFFAYCAG